MTLLISVRTHAGLQGSQKTMPSCAVNVSDEEGIEIRKDRAIMISTNVGAMK